MIRGRLTGSDGGTPLSIKNLIKLRGGFFLFFNSHLLSLKKKIRI